ncbi:WSC domain-containing protein [Aspergillus keveii]|uniref:WSC domain-containing protein n=1 Tax=Aspergillus keveii TaxID=714993 RepID=A0ABR4G4K3_9EURO
MRTTLLSLTALATLHLSTASPTPGLYADPNTIASCVEWYDNTEGLTCKELRDYFTITPEQFTEWNPSVSLDCEPWNEWQSYCIVTQERLDDTASSLSASLSASATAASTASSTTSTTTLAPSPTAWAELGCYFDDPSHLPLLESRVSANDEALTIGTCQDACYRAAYQFAGVKGGNECWCSPFVGGEWARDQEDCNLPCTGDDSEICGGEETVVVFEAEYDDDFELEDVDEDDGVITLSGTASASASTSTISTSTSTPTSKPGDESEHEGAVDESTAESKASRNLGPFGLYAIEKILGYLV